MEDNTMFFEILEEMIKAIFDTENCGGDWYEKCEENPFPKCVKCCRGIYLLKKLALCQEGSAYDE